MASFLDIVPALGRGLDFAQGFPGGYDAIDLRRTAGLGRQEGAVTAGAYKVAQRAAGANMSADVATQDGAFLVQGDTVAHQGLYYVAPTALGANLDIAAADPTNPRVDQVVIEARDDAHTGDGITRGRAYILTGTPTAGATLDNRSGAAALPASTARCADILVPAASTAVTAGNIRDRRPWASGLNVVYPMTGGNHDNATQTLTTAPGSVVRCEISAGQQVEIAFEGVAYVTNAGNANSQGQLWQLLLAGITNYQVTQHNFAFDRANANLAGVLYRAVIDQPAAGSYLAQLQHALSKASAAGDFSRIVQQAISKMRVRELGPTSNNN